MKPVTVRHDLHNLSKFFKYAKKHAQLDTREPGIVAYFFLADPGSAIE